MSILCLCRLLKVFYVNITSTTEGIQILIGSKLSDLREKQIRVLISILQEGIFKWHLMKSHRFLPEPPVQIWSEALMKRTNHDSPLFNTGNIWLLSCYHSFCFPINRTDAFSPLKASPLPGVINLLQLNYYTKHSPVSKGDGNDCGRTEVWICINSKWLCESSQRVMRICCKMKRINHWWSTRYLGCQPAFHVCSGIAVVEEITFQSTKNWFVFFKTNGIPIPIKK